MVSLGWWRTLRFWFRFTPGRSHIAAIISSTTTSMTTTRSLGGSTRASIIAFLCSPHSARSRRSSVGSFISTGSTTAITTCHSATSACGRTLRGRRPRRAFSRPSAASPRRSASGL
eukprot:Amastigsp_a345796_93.p3 type:complete len:116 gc:universal Amastigsp_a345796_93:814-467(-)